jgi:hypothetical protein
VYNAAASCWMSAIHSPSDLSFTHRFRYQHDSSIATEPGHSCGALCCLFRGIGPDRRYSDDKVHRSGANHARRQPLLKNTDEVRVEA